MSTSLLGNRGSLPVTLVTQGGDVKVGCLGFAGTEVSLPGLNFHPMPRRCNHCYSYMNWLPVPVMTQPWAMPSHSEAEGTHGGSRLSNCSSYLAWRPPAWLSWKQTQRAHGVEMMCPLVLSAHESMFAEVLVALVPKILHLCNLSGFLLAAWARTDSLSHELDGLTSLSNRIL